MDFDSSAFTYFDVVMISSKLLISHISQFVQEKYLC